MIVYILQFYLIVTLLSLISLLIKGKVKLNDSTYEDTNFIAIFIWFIYYPYNFYYDSKTKKKVIKRNTRYWELRHDKLKIIQKELKDWSEEEYKDWDKRTDQDIFSQMQQEDYNSRKSKINF